MKKKRFPLIFFSILVSLTSLSSFFFGKTLFEEKGLKRAEKASIALFEAPITVVIDGDRKEEELQQLLTRVLAQKYTQFSVVLIATDGYVVPEDLPRRHKLSLKVASPGSFEAELHEIVHTLPDNAIVVPLARDETIKDTSALSVLNRYFAGSDMAVALSCENEEESGNLSFRAAAYKKIPLGELIAGSAFVQKGFEGALFARDDVSLLGEKLIQGGSAVFTAQTTVKSSGELAVEDPRCDLLVFSYNRPLQLMALLESVQRNFLDLGRVFVLYRADGEYVNGYERLVHIFPKATFVRQSAENPKGDFKEKCVDILFSGKYSTSSHVLFAVDDIVATGSVAVKDALKVLEKTRAHGVYLRLGKEISHCYMWDMPQKVPCSLEVAEGMFAYKIPEAEWDWKYPNTLDMTMYRKSDLRAHFSELAYSNPTELETVWNEAMNIDYLAHARKDHSGKEYNPHLLGLYYEKSKVVNIPLNVVASGYTNRNMHEYSTEELFSYFKQGMKIDIEKMQGIEHHSCHAEIDVEFIKDAALIQK